jgi:muconolactone delta-isomerase
VASAAGDDRRERLAKEETVAKFMVEGALREPPSPEALALIPAEVARGTELDRQGVRAGLYVAADMSRAWQVYDLGSVEEVECVLATFPLHPHLRLTITPLAE